MKADTPALPLSITRSAEITAADCNAQLELPLPALVQALIEAATDHADQLGVGHSRLAEDGHSWVLMRLTAELTRLPRVDERYEIRTWVHSLARRFSIRDFEISVGGRPIGLCRSVWGVIDSAQRSPATLEGLEALEAVARHEPREPRALRRLRPADFDAGPDVTAWQYRVAVSDIDFNRHLTSSRYISLMLDSWTLGHFDRYAITGFEISFGHEARYGDLLQIERRDFPAEGDAAAEAGCRLLMADGLTPLATASIRFDPRQS